MIQPFDYLQRKRYENYTRKVLTSVSQWSFECVRTGIVARSPFSYHLHACTGLFPMWGQAICFTTSTFGKGGRKLFDVWFTLSHVHTFLSILAILSVHHVKVFMNPMIDILQRNNILLGFFIFGRDSSKLENPLLHTFFFRELQGRTWCTSCSIPSSTYVPRVCIKR